MASELLDYSGQVFIVERMRPTMRIDDGDGEQVSRQTSDVGKNPDLRRGRREITEAFSRGYYRAETGAKTYTWHLAFARPYTPSLCSSRLTAFSDLYAAAIWLDAPGRRYTPYGLHLENFDKLLDLL